MDGPCRAKPEPIAKPENIERGFQGRGSVSPFLGMFVLLKFGAMQIGV